MSDLSNKNFEPSRKLAPEALEEIAGIFRVMADSNRLALLQELKGGEKTVGELSDTLQTGQPSVSKHLGMLAAANLVKRRKEGVKVFYSLKGELVSPLCRLVCEKLSDDQQNRGMVDFSI